MQLQISSSCLNVSSSTGGLVYFPEYNNSVQSEIGSWTGTLVYNDDTSKLINFSSPSSLGYPLIYHCRRQLSLSNATANNLFSFKYFRLNYISGILLFSAIPNVCKSFYVNVLVNIIIFTIFQKPSNSARISFLSTFPRTGFLEPRDSVSITYLGGLLSML